MEIKVGDYVRTKEGKIAQCISHEDKTYNFDRYIDIYYDDEYIDYVYDEELEEWKEYFNVKVFTNIIDLIEIGDYVNGKLVFDINGTLFAQELGALEDIIIKSVVTHEQIESMEYRIGD